jgi:hypothetical protein|tara:strand:+ start:754 stop:1632 length:879 start_codon:yes stop_codon:yes gene_type:complete
MQFNKATKKKAKLRAGLYSVAGGGKTMTALLIAKGIGGKVAFIDTEHGSASKYSDLFEFDVCEIDSFNPKELIKGLEDIPSEYDTVIIDSMSAFWQGKDGILQQVENAGKRNQGGNSFRAWADVSPVLNRINDLVMGAPYHVITTLRAKTEYVVEQNDKGKAAPRKIGLAPVYKEGWEYNLDFVARMDTDNTMIVEKTRIPEFAGLVVNKPDEEIGKRLAAWLGDGEAMPSPMEQLQVLIAEVTTPEAFIKLASDRGHIKEGIKDLSKIPNEKVNYFLQNWNSIAPLLKDAT